MLWLRATTRLENMARLLLNRITCNKEIVVEEQMSNNGWAYCTVYKEQQYTGPYVFEMSSSLTPPITFTRTMQLSLIRTLTLSVQ